MLLTYIFLRMKSNVEQDSRVLSDFWCVFGVQQVLDEGEKLD